MTAKDLLKWKVEPLAGAFSSPLQPLLQQLQKQLESGQFPDALRSLHDSFVFLTMLYGGIAVGSLRSVTPLGPDLTLLLDEKPSAEVWARMLRQSWQDWTKHPHHPALEAIRGVFFLGSRLQSSRLGARRHSRWLGLDARANTNGESFGGWTETVRKAKNINPEAAARQLVMKLPLLNIWLRAGQDFLANWTLRLDPRQEPGQFRYLLNREDCRFDTQPNLSLDQLILKVELLPQGDFSVTNQVAEATPAPPNPPAAAAPKPAEPSPSPAAKGDVGLQWDPVTKSYRLVGGASPAPSKTAPPTPPAPVAPTPQPKPETAPHAPVTPAAKSSVAVEWDAATNSYRMVDKGPAVQAEPVEPAPNDDIDAMLKAELQSLEDLLSDDPIGDLAKSPVTSSPAPGPEKTFGQLGDMGLDFLMGETTASAVAKPKLGPPPVLEEPSLEELLGSEPAEPGLEALLVEEARQEPSLEDLLGDDSPSETSLEDLLEEPATPAPTPVAVVEAQPEPSLEDLLGDEPITSVPVLPPTLSRPPSALQPAKSSTLGPPPPLPDDGPTLDDLLSEATTATESTSLDDLLLADEPPVETPAVAESGPSLDDLLAEEPPPPVESAPAPENAPSLDDLLAEE
ncbi:hypothetical protein JST97_02015, partial [bacterium]|nr:hypothetical protein [bacterium]